MQAMVCELCGSTNIVKKDDMFQCQHCGAKYSVEEAKKLIGSVKSVNNQTEKYLTLARRAKEENNAENAAKYYELVLLENPMSWEAAFYTVYFKAMECRIIDIESAVYSVANNISGTIRLIHDTVTSGEQAEAVTEVITRSAVIVNKFATAAMNLYNSFSQVDGVRSECSDHIVAAGSILNQLENGLKSYFTGNKQSIVEVQKLQLSYISNYAKCTIKNIETQKSTDLQMKSGSRIAHLHRQRLKRAAATSPPRSMVPTTARRFGRSAVTVMIRWRKRGTGALLCAPTTRSARRWSSGLAKPRGLRSCGAASSTTWSSG